ncbi:hypothetical protein [Dyadobacter sp. 3J3]|uniref:hypothetical protein n=1 Tax=Dyadobacter sp. 3J3 TaxID=2606600 RepID=UPI001357CBF8|nr:hypothetical protein [Dyadobacter sp. 3J3]
MNAVNNFQQIRSLLNWESDGDYYYCQLILRKKDGATTFGNKNNSARLIKTYCFFNFEQFDQKQDEIIQLCEEFKCRAGISLNKRNEERITLELLKQITERIISKNHIGINGILNSANGQQTSKDRFWLIDCDSPEEMAIASQILSDESIKPDGNKILTTIPTYDGFHLVTNKFDVMYFNKLCQEKGISVEIHKNNPVALYYPSK